MSWLHPTDRDHDPDAARPVGDLDNPSTHSPCEDEPPLSYRGTEGLHIELSVTVEPRRSYKMLHRCRGAALWHKRCFIYVQYGQQRPGEGKES